MRYTLCARLYAKIAERGIFKRFSDRGRSIDKILHFRCATCDGIFRKGEEEIGLSLSLSLREGTTAFADKPFRSVIKPRLGENIGTLTASYAILREGEGEGNVYSRSKVSPSPRFSSLPQVSFLLSRIHSDALS